MSGRALAAPKGAETFFPVVGRSKVEVGER
jgi:hypothetical protein